MDFGESAASLTFHDPDDALGVDTQADDFRFQFTLPSQDFSNSLDDHQLQDNIKMVERLTISEEIDEKPEFSGNRPGDYFIY